MNKTEYLQLKEAIITRLGKPEFEMGDPVNECARELKKLQREFRSQQQKEVHAKKKALLEDDEQHNIVREYQSRLAVPIDLSDTDLELFKDYERPIVRAFYQNTNQTASELAAKFKDVSYQKIVALMRSGPFQVLYDKIYSYLMPMKVRNALLKAVDEGNARLVERLAEQTGALKNQEMTLNVNKPLEDPALTRKLKELGDGL